MRTRRLDALGRAMKHIKQRTPRIFSRYCARCDCDIKGEPMWRYTAWTYSEKKVWTCMTCAPTKLEIIQQNPADFGGIDTLPLVDDTAKAKRDKYLGYT